MDVLAQRFQERFAVPPAVIARAPGRVEIVGNHTDYNGGLVVGAAIDLSVRVAAARSGERVCKIASGSRNGVYVFDPDAEIVACSEAEYSWVNFVLGCYRELVAASLAPSGGWCLWIESDLPAGAGLSSSAALELAVLYALTALAGHTPERMDMMRMAHRAENKFVGVPCGILDQGTSAFGQKNSLVMIDCATEAFSLLPVPESTVLYLFNSNKAHSLVDSLYSTRHQECSQALSVLQCRYPQLQHLAHADPEQVEAVRGELSIEAYKRALHVVNEQRRVQRVAEVLQQVNVDQHELGHLLNQSHASSRQLFENSCAELDTLVDLLQAEKEVYASRLTGGGFGGSVLALADRLSIDTQNRVKMGYAQRYGYEPSILEVRLADGADIE